MPKNKRRPNLSSILARHKREDQDIRHFKSIKRLAAFYIQNLNPNEPTCENITNISILLGWCEDKIKKKESRLLRKATEEYQLYLDNLEK